MLINGRENGLETCQDCPVKGKLSMRNRQIRDLRRTLRDQRMTLRDYWDYSQLPYGGTVRPDITDRVRAILDTSSSVS